MNAIEKSKQETGVGTAGGRWHSGLIACSGRDSLKRWHTAKTWWGWRNGPCGDLGRNCPAQRELTCPRWLQNCRDLLPSQSLSMLPCSVFPSPLASCNKWHAVGFKKKKRKEKRKRHSESVFLFSVGKCFNMFGLNFSIFIMVFLFLKVLFFSFAISFFSFISAAEQIILNHCYLKVIFL